jgi:hypothetical protein
MDLLDRAPKMSKALKTKIYEKLFILIPNDPEMIKLGRRLVKGSESMPALGRVLHYLVAYDQDWVEEELAKLPIHADSLYQSAMSDFLFRKCPKGWDKAVGRMRDLKKISPESIKQIQDKCGESRGG